MLSTEIKNSLMKIHIMYHAKNNKGITADFMCSEIKNHGYECDLPIIENELEQLKSENFLILKDEEYSITEEGERVFSELKEKVAALHKEIN